MGQVPGEYIFVVNIFVPCVSISQYITKPRVSRLINNLIIETIKIVDRVSISTISYFKLFLNMPCKLSKII